MEKGPVTLALASLLMATVVDVVVSAATQLSLHPRRRRECLGREQSVSSP